MSNVTTTRTVLCSIQADPAKIDAYIRSKNPEIEVNENLLRIYAKAVIAIAGGHTDKLSDQELLVAMSICKLPVITPAEFLAANDPQRTQEHVPSTGAAAGEDEAPEPVRVDNSGPEDRPADR